MSAAPATPAGLTRWTRLGLVVALFAASTPAAADETAEPSTKVSTRITAKGEVVATMHLPFKAAAIREILGSAERSHGLAPTTVSAKATPDGTCERVKLKTRGLFAPFELETRRCPTARGWRETMVSSTDFVEYWNEWVLEDAAGGTKISFHTRTLPNVAVPEALIHAETRRVLARLLHNLQAALGDH